MQDEDVRMRLFDLPGGQRISYGALQRLLPDIETTLFFAKVYSLGVGKLSELLSTMWSSSVVDALSAGDHSTSLQDYLFDVAPEYLKPELKFVADAPEEDSWELLPLLWEDAMVTVAKAISEVADKLVGTLGRLPSKEGKMLFQSMAKMNRVRPTVGVHQAHISHQSVPDVAVVLDVSGSMSESTIKAIIGDVVAMSWKANAHLFIVSSDAFHWEPGSYDVESVLKKAQYGGTVYETLAPAFDRAWGSVITIADYDSGCGTKEYIRRNCPNGHIGSLYDISLVNRPTHLGEVLGQMADEVTPLLIAQRSFCW